MCLTGKATANLLQCFCLKPSNMPRWLEEDILANPAVILIVGVLVYIPLITLLCLSWVCCRNVLIVFRSNPRFKLQTVVI